MSDLFLDFAGPFLVSEVLSLGGGSDLSFLGGVGPKLLIWSGASLRFSPREASLFDWWPGRSCSDVPAASGSSCNTNEATDSVRPLLQGNKRDIKNKKTPCQNTPQTMEKGELQCHIHCSHSDLQQIPKVYNVLYVLLYCEFYLE